MAPGTRSPLETRLEVQDDPRSAEAFARAMTRGLGSAPRAIDARWLLDDAGVALLRELRRQPDHYVATAERQVLEARADAVPLYFPDKAPLVVEYGVADTARTGALLTELLEAFGSLEYVAVGPSLAAVEPPCRELLAAHPRLSAKAQVGRLEDALAVARAATSPGCVFWPGADLGARERAEAIGTLRSVSSILRGRALLVAGVDLGKDPRVAERCHADRKGVGKRLHMHLLTRLVRELGADLDPALFRHRTQYDAESGRLDAFVVSRRSQAIRLAALDLTVELAKGEAIRVETATKFSPQEIDLTARAADLNVHERWYDRDGRVCLNLMRPAPPAT